MKRRVNLHVEIVIDTANAPFGAGSEQHQAGYCAAGLFSLAKGIQSFYQTGGKIKSSKILSVEWQEPQPAAEADGKAAL